jgi:hypothetical protein
MKILLTLMAILLTILLGLNPLFASADQKCKNSIIATSPDSDFIINDDGTVTQKKTSLMWMRCNPGQKWDGSTCTGTAATFTWREALETADLEKFAGYADWRLPNKNELESIVAENCILPAVNTKVFPATQTEFHWTSTPYAGLGTGAWSVDFGYAVVTATEKSGKLYIRLVRDTD